MFKLTLDGVVSVLHAFTGGIDGANSYGALIQAADGRLYGTTLQGGTSGVGTAFTIAPDGTFAILYAFTAGADGAGPNGLVLATDGNFYGTTQAGGPSNAGTAFNITPAGVLTVLHAFGNAEGGRPMAALIQSAVRT